MNKDINVFLEKIVNYLLKGIIVILPLFFLPLNIVRLGMDTLNKEHLLWLVSPIIFSLLLYKIINSHGFILRSKFDKYILAFLALITLSALFGNDVFSSFFGAYASQTQSVVSVLALILMFYVLINCLNEFGKVFGIIKLLLTSYGLITFIAVLLLIGGSGESGVLTKYFSLAVGNREDLSIYLAVMSSLTLFVITDKKLLQKLFANVKFEWLLRISFLSSLLILILVDYYLSWVLLLSAGVLTIIIQKARKDRVVSEQKGWKKLFFHKFWQITVLLISTIFLINHFAYGGLYTEKLRFYQNFQLDSGNSFNIAIEALKDNLVFGSGPETFANQFSLYRSAEFNAREHWAIRFNQSASFILEMIATNGLLPSLAYLFLLFYILAYGFRKIIGLKKTGEENGCEPALLFGIWSTISVLVLLQFFFPVTLVLRFLLWVFLGTGLAYLNLCHKQELLTRLEFKSIDNRKGIAVPMFLFSILAFTVAAFEVRFWIADTVYAKAVSAENRIERESGLNQALRLNKYRSNFYAALSKHYYNIVREEMQKNSQDYDMDLINENINKSIRVAQDGLVVNPSSVVLYETLGMVYRSMNVISGNTGPLAKAYFAKASELEPSNPIIKTELAKAMFASREYENAISTYKEAIALKDDYYDAHFNLARAYIQIGNNAEALDLLNGYETDINNPEFYYERGRANYNLKNHKQAISDFKKIISNSPLHSNALYSLGLALNETGEYDEALVYLNKALISNPNNDVLKKMIAEIEAKK